MPNIFSCSNFRFRRNHKESWIFLVRLIRLIPLVTRPTSEASSELAKLPPSGRCWISEWRSQVSNSSHKGDVGHAIGAGCFRVSSCRLGLVPLSRWEGLKVLVNVRSTLMARLGFRWSRHREASVLLSSLRSTIVRFQQCNPCCCRWKLLLLQSRLYSLSRLTGNRSSSDFSWLCLVFALYMIAPNTDPSQGSESSLN